VISVEDGEQGPGGALPDCVAALRRFLAEPPPPAPPDDLQVLENLRVAEALVATAEAVRLVCVRAVDERPACVPGARSGSAALTFLVEALRVSPYRARRDVLAAAALDADEPSLPLLGRALAAGQVSREHVDVAVSTLEQVPRVLREKVFQDDSGADVSGAVLIDRMITEESLGHPPTTIERLGRQLVHRLDPLRSQRLDADSHERRRCTLATNFAGMGVLNAHLDQVTHLEVRGILDRFSGPRPAGTAVDEDGVEVCRRDPRTLVQRRADAVVDLLRAGAATLGAVPPTPSPAPSPVLSPMPSPEPGSAPPPSDGDEADACDDAPASGRGPAVPGAAFGLGPVADVAVICTVDQLAAAFGAEDPDARAAGLARMGLAGRVASYAGATLHPSVLARLACDSPLRRILVDPHGAVLHHGRSRRLATTAQRRALAVRDAGCVIPACASPPEWCEAHHVIPWGRGGVTDVGGMALLCRHHHTAVHAGVYDLAMREGIPWVRLPAWQDPARPWQRNTTHEHARLADDVARRLADDGPNTGTT